VILLDLMMPVVDGPTFRERQLGDPQLDLIRKHCLQGGSSS